MSPSLEVPAALWERLGQAFPATEEVELARLASSASGRSRGGRARPSSARTSRSAPRP